MTDSNLSALRLHRTRMRRAFRDNRARRVSDPPEVKKCPDCQEPMVIDGAYWICIDLECGHTELRFKLRK